MAIISSNQITKDFIKVERRWPYYWNKQTEVKQALKGLSLEIEEGEFVGFLGPNGAGKTTFLKILSGIMHPTSGEASVLGYTPWERNYDYLRQMAIVMGQKNQLWWDLPAIDSFNLLREIYSVPEKRFKKTLDQVVEVMGMKELLTKRLRNMSLGERMKCELAASFLHEPKIIYLDEPTIGLDVVSARSVREFLKKMNREKNYTFILTSHYIGDIEELCERVIIIDKGQKIYDGKLKALIEKYAPEKRIEIFLSNLEEKKKFAHLSAKKKKIIQTSGLILAEKNELGQVVKEVFDKFPPENISINDPDAEEIIGRIFKGNIK